ncbi:LacI family DNA-binding transcriptional regulator [Homoserinibacter sp. GY 40078]|uniref:LacI family DNA-binding transcriptional regulator n=1 Tax=Homoserinibacter sp. GY 40078 TaxID=2603275 RepID=UPI0011C9B79E|nr:LacI family DNA-binding transcriptional regulator [Homoserinibacter sp. GY 40078]TXK18698.1 LacI family transcriptional regulator [Homoserinibacter sp. GY 40078]
MAPEPPGGPPTLERVAAVAGVSRSTVSRVVNGSPKVAPAAVEAVHRAIEDLGYVPNRAARILASRRTQSIALVIPENTARFFADPFFATVVQGIAMYLADTDYTLSLLIAAEKDAEKTRRYLQAGNVDGALVLSHHSDDRSYVQLAKSIPVVFGGRPMSAEGSDAYYVDVDNVAAASDATHRLVARGRRRIATIAGPADMSAGLDRAEGWRRALEEAGMPTDLIEHGDFSPAGGEAAMRRLLERDPAIDGLFVASSLMASGALNVLRGTGRIVPRDLGLVTFDNDYAAQSSSPPLTTVEQPTVELGRRMVDVLLQRIAGHAVPIITVMPTRVIERGTE